MNKTFVSDVEKLSPSDILEIIIESYRTDLEIEDIQLTFESTVKEWRDACELLDWKQLGRAINEYFSVNFPDDQWREALEPARQRTLKDVCELLSTKATRVAVKPFSIAGVKCLSAGSFLAVRTALKNAGLPVAQIKPSTKLSPYLVKNWVVFWSEIDKIAPGVLTDFKIKYHLHYLPIFLVVIGILSAALSQYFDVRILLLWPLIFIGAALSAIVYNYFFRQGLFDSGRWRHSGI